MTKARRSYHEGCIAAHALDLIGDRWALLVVRELMLGPKRFGALREGLPGISANVLTVRLGELEAQGILRREDLPPPAGVGLYALTEAGRGLWPVIRALCQWGAGQPGHDPARFISPTALMLSMRAMCRVARAGHHLAEMRPGSEVFTITTAPGRFEVVPGPSPEAGLRLEGQTNDLAAALYGPRPLAETAAGRIRFAGDLAEGQAFVDLFSLRG